MTPAEAPVWASERVLWRGRPRQVLVFERAGLLRLALVAILLASSLHRIISRGQTTSALIYLVLCVTTLLGNGIVPTVARAWRLRGTEYVITDRRAVAISTAPGQRVERVAAHTPRSAPALVRERSDGAGTVVFGSLSSPLDSAFGPECQRSPLILHDIDPARQLGELIRQHGDPRWSAGSISLSTPRPLESR